MIIRPDDIVRPTKQCISIMHKFREHHRGTVTAWPDRERHVVCVKWHHLKHKPVNMAYRYVEKVIEP